MTVNRIRPSNKTIAGCPECPLVRAQDSQWLCSGELFLGLSDGLRPLMGHMEDDQFVPPTEAPAWCPLRMGQVTLHLQGVTELAALPLNAIPAVPQYARDFEGFHMRETSNGRGAWFLGFRWLSGERLIVLNTGKCDSCGKPILTNENVRTLGVIGNAVPPPVWYDLFRYLFENGVEPRVPDARTCMDCSGFVPSSRYD